MRYAGTAMIPLAVLVDSVATHMRFVKVLFAATLPRLVDHRLPVILFDDLHRQVSDQSAKVGKRSPCNLHARHKTEQPLQREDALAFQLFLDECLNHIRHAPQREIAGVIVEASCHQLVAFILIRDG